MLGFLRGGNKRTKTIWWVLIFVTVATFIGGFVFLLGSGLSSGSRARATGAVATVNGQPIGRTEFQNALTDQRDNYKRNFGSEPMDRDLKMVQVQALRSLIYQRILSQEARKAGLRASDPEVVIGLQTNPPAMLMNSPTFQTNGKFDNTKYQAALKDPNNNWSPFEDLERQQLPTRKLQERLLASIKVSEAELLDAYHQRYDRVTADAVLLTPVMTGAAPQITDADLQRTFDKYRDRFVASAHTEVEILTVPKKYGEPETKAARDMAENLTRRARSGEDFGTLARDYSEGPSADQGGVIQRPFQPGDFEPALGAKLAALPPGGIADPFQDASRFVILQRLAPDSTTPAGALKLAQIIVRVRPNDETIRQQYEQVQKMRNQAKNAGLGRVAAANGMGTAKSGPYDANNTPQALFSVPEAANWGLSAPLHEVSPVFEGPDEFVVVQVTSQEPAGPVKRAQVEQQLRQITEIDLRMQRMRGRADSLAQLARAGRPLAQAAAAMGLSPFRVADMSRAQPDNRLGDPKLIGVLFGGRPGQVLGPVESLNGWLVARVDSAVVADTVAYATVKGPLVNDILERRQRAFLSGYLNELRGKAKIRDMTSEAGY